ncbi:MAG: DUF664 domain-containing protein [candidate division Zixibacteria bacterium]|nr:DUF664 domain-containing protein [candidate division Zixibacteria bacterium]
MQTSKEIISGYLLFNSRTLDMTLRGFNDENSHTRPGDTGNSANFIFGHLVVHRIQIAKLLGIEFENPFPELFDYKAKIRDSSTYPALSVIREVWDELNERVNDRIENLTGEELEADGPYEVKPFPKTIGGCLCFLIFHEAYHIGQIGYIRKFNDLEAAFG